MRSRSWYSVCSSLSLYKCFKTRVRTMTSVGYGGRPPRQASPLGQQGVDSLREVGKVDVPGDELQRVAQGFYFVLVGSVGKQIGLDCAARGLDGH